MTAPEPQPRYWGPTRRVTLQRVPRYGAAVYAHVLIDGGVVGWVWKSGWTGRWHAFWWPAPDVWQANAGPPDDVQRADNLDDAVTRVLARTRPELVEP